MKRARAFDLDHVRGLVAQYQALQGLGDWTFTVELVPGLLHGGEPAWATVDSDPATKTARVRVRDLAATPVPGVADQGHELEVTISHELWHPWVTLLLAEPTEENEERLVEAAAQAVVGAKGATARVMARSVEAIPRLCHDRKMQRELRARLAKISAPRGRATKGRPMGMTPETVKALVDAIEAGDAAKMTEIGKQLLVEAATGGPAPAEDVAPESNPEPPMAKPVNPPPKPGAPAPVANPAEDDSARRARRAADSLSKSAIRARIHEMRTVDGVTLAPELEKMVLAETDIDAAEKLLKVAALSRGDGTRARAESGERPGAPAPPAPSAVKIDADALLKEGIHPNLVKDVAEMAAKGDAESVKLTLTAARARLASTSSPWPTAKTNGVGGAS